MNICIRLISSYENQSEKISLDKQSILAKSIIILIFSIINLEYSQDWNILSIFLKNYLILCLRAKLSILKECFQYQILLYLPLNMMEHLNLLESASWAFIIIFSLALTVPLLTFGKIHNYEILVCLVTFNIEQHNWISVDSNPNYFLRQYKIRFLEFM